MLPTTETKNWISYGWDFAVESCKNMVIFHFTYVLTFSKSQSLIHLKLDFIINLRCYRFNTVFERLLAYNSHLSCFVHIILKVWDNSKSISLWPLTFYVKMYYLFGNTFYSYNMKFFEKRPTFVAILWSLCKRYGII